MSKEQVLVFPAERLRFYEGLFNDSVVTDPLVISDMLHDLLSPDAVRFIDRDRAENDPSFKQVIPYCVLYKQSEVETLYFIYQRTPRSGEARLHQSWSIGVGGHINPCDLEEEEDAYIAGLNRELHEEIGLKPDETPPVAGIIYDSSNEVGRVHVGIVHLMEIADGDKVVLKDSSLDFGVWSSVKALTMFNLENWSKLLVEHILSGKGDK